MVNATLRNATTNALLKTEDYTYDLAGNRIGVTTDGVLSPAIANGFNQLTEVGGPGSLTIAGRVSEPAAVTVNGVAAQMGLNGLDFAATIPVTTGQNTLSITAMETQASSPGLNLQSTTGSVSVDIADETRRTLTYDANGSTATDSLGRTYEWDRANRLKAIAYSGPGSKRTEFSYDHLGRWNRLVERDHGVITADQRFLWDGFKIAEERDATGTVTKRYYPEGLQDVTASQNNFYGLDHLGSVRTITDATGALQTHLQFDPWGRRNESPFNGPSAGFTGHYHYKHRDEVPGDDISDGLELAPFRTYEGSLAKWLSRDPIEELGGMNLYGYVENNSVNAIDRNGLSPSWALPPELAGGDSYSKDFQQGWYDQARLAPVALLALPAGLVGEALLPTMVFMVKTCQGQQGGQLVSNGVRAFMKGEKSLSTLSRTEIELAKKGYQHAADTAKNAAHRAYQEARIRALEGKGPPPGPLVEFMKTYKPQ